MGYALNACPAVSLLPSPAPLYPHSLPHTPLLLCNYVLVFTVMCARNLCAGGNSYSLHGLSYTARTSKCYYVLWAPPWSLLQLQPYSCKTLFVASACLCANVTLNLLVVLTFQKTFHPLTLPQCRLLMSTKRWMMVQEKCNRKLISYRSLTLSSVWMVGGSTCNGGMLLWQVVLNMRVIMLTQCG